MYKNYNIYFAMECSQDFVSDINCQYNIESNIQQDQLFVEQFAKENPQYNIFYFSKNKLFDNFTWISNVYDADIVILKTSMFDNFSKNTFSNVILLVDDLDNLLKSLVYLYQNISGYLDISLSDNFDKNLLYNILDDYSIFVSEQISSGNFTYVKQLTSFFNEEKFSSFGENSVFVSPDNSVYYHPSFYWSGNKTGYIGNIKDFFFSESLVHSSRPHIVCHSCETFYCNRSIYSNKIETGELKVPSFSECKKTTIFTIFSKRIFNNIQDNISLNEFEILDRLDTKFDAEIEFHKIENNLILTNKIKGIHFNYVEIAKENIDWNSKK